MNTEDTIYESTFYIYILCKNVDMVLAKLLQSLIV